MKYKAIIFDFFGVISSRVAPFWIRDNFSEDRISEIVEKYITPADKSEINGDELYKKLSELVSRPPEEIQKEWHDLSILNPQVIELIEKLKKDYKIILLSNAIGPFLRELIEGNNLERLFDDIVISSEVGVMKPNPEIYKETLKRSGLLPGEVIFTDDNESNIKKAEELGIKSILFTDASLLESNLKKFISIN